MTENEAFKASVGSVQRIAMRILEVPKDHREAAIEIARRNFTESLEAHGQDHAEGHAWVDLQVQGICALIAEIESGGPISGRA